VTGAPEESQGSIKLEGIDLAYVSWGPSDAPVLLCLHGWLDNAYSFAPLAPFLGDRRLIALELAGHGHSGHRAPGAQYHYLDWVRDVWRAADALGLGELSLVGHSMGAGVAALAAGTRPARVRHLVMIEGTGPRSARPEDLPQSLADHIAFEAKVHAAPRRARPAAFEIAVRARLASSPVSRASAELLARRGTFASGDGVMWRNDRRLSHMHPADLEESQVRAFLKRIDCPTMLIRADRGVQYDRALVAARLACIDDFQEVEVPGQHHAHMDDPEPVARQIRRLLGLDPTDLSELRV
jgi:pimeloyl-ACP methyl ester carboxylesterase